MGDLEWLSFESRLDFMLRQFEVEGGCLRFCGSRDFDYMLSAGHVLDGDVIVLENERSFRRDGPGVPYVVDEGCLRCLWSFSADRFSSVRSCVEVLGGGDRTWYIADPIGFARRFGENYKNKK